jgi:hypothetical protein
MKSFGMDEDFTKNRLFWAFKQQNKVNCIKLKYPDRFQSSVRWILVLVLNNRGRVEQKQWIIYRNVIWLSRHYPLKSTVAGT